MRLKYTNNSRCYMGHIPVPLQHHCVQVQMHDTHDDPEISQKETMVNGEKVLAMNHSMIITTNLLNMIMAGCDDDNESRLETDQF